MHESIVLSLVKRIQCVFRKLFSCIRHVMSKTCAACPPVDFVVFFSTDWFDICFRYLHLSHNSLTAIKPSTFGTLPTLLAIDVSHNKLASVSRGSLAKLQSCREIDLRHNFIESIFQIPAALA